MRNKVQLLVLLMLMATSVSAQYNVNIGVMTNGSVTTTTPNVAQGTEVTLNVTPADGYYIEASDIIVAPTSNVAQARRRAPGIASAVAVTAVSESLTPEGLGQFKFTMPASNVTISATFYSRTDIGASCTVTLSPTSFDYDGTEHKATASDVSYSGSPLAGEDGHSGTTNLKREYDITPIYSSADYVNAGERQVKFALRGKYKGFATGTFTIAKRNITVKAKNQDIQYGGSFTNSLENAELTAGDLVSGHSITGVSIVNTATGSTTGTNGKTYPAGDTYTGVLQISSSSVVIEDAEGNDVSSNYNVTHQAGDLTIGSFPLAYAAVEILEHEFDYDGNGHEATVKVYQNRTDEGNYTGFISPDQYDVLFYNNVYPESVTLPVNTGTYTIKLSAKSGSDLTGEKDNVGTMTISPVGMTATANDVTKFYTEDLPELTATYSGYIEADEATLNPGVLATDATVESPLGTYNVYFSTSPSFTTGNYTVSTENGTLTVLQLPLDFANANLWDNEKTYNGSVQAASVEIESNGISIPAPGNYSIVYLDGEGAEVSPVDVGTYTIVARASETGCLTGEKEIGVLTISPKPVSNSTGDITIEAGAPTYDGTALAPTSLVVKDGNLTVPTSDYTATYSNNVNAGNDAQVTLTMTGNYSGIITDNYTINPRPVTVTAKEQTILFGQNIRTGSGTATATGLLEGHTLKSTSVSTTITEVGTYPEGITVSGAWIVAGETDMTANYDVTYVPGPLNIVAENANPDITVEPIEAQTYDGTAKEPAVTVKDGTTELANGTDYTVTYENNTDAGTAKAIIKLTEGSSLIEEFTINPKTATITASPQTIVYGQAVSSTTSDVAVTGLLDGHTLTAITLTPSSTAVGTQTLTPSVAAVSSATEDVTGNYAFTYEDGALTINRKSYSDHQPDFAIENIGSYVYNGQAQKPVPVVKDNQSTLSTVLEEGKDYTLAYSNNTNAGTATITVNLQGNYEGSMTKDFSIETRTTYLKMLDQTILQGNNPQSTINYAELTEQVPGHTLGSVTLKSNSNREFATLAAGDYQVELGFTTPTTIVDGTNTDVTANYTLVPVSGNLTVLAKADDSFTMTINGSSTFEYTGQPQMPTVIVKKNSETLYEGSDYTLTYQGETEAGTGYVIARLQGEYSGALMESFTINKRSIAIRAKDQTIVYGTTIDEGVYNAEALSGSEALETVTIHHLGNVMLTADESATEVGTYTDAITPSNASIVDGDGNDVTKNYTITGYTTGDLTIIRRPYDDMNFTIDLSDNSYAYTATAHEPEPTVKFGNKTLVKGTDFSVTYIENVNAGTAYVNFSFNGNYTGETQKAFEITRRRATLTPNEQTITYGEQVSSETTDVTVEGLLSGHSLGSVALAADKSVEGIHPSGMIITGASVVSGTEDVTNNYELVFGVNKLTIRSQASILHFSGSGEWATYYSDDQVRLKGGLTAYYVTAVSESYVTVMAISGGVIPAKMPVLLNRGDERTETSFECELVGDDTTGSDAGVSNYKGVSTDTSIPRGYYILINDKFVRSDAGTLSANRCYLTELGSSGARMRSIIIDNGDGTMVFDPMDSEAGMTDQWFSLDGRRISEPWRKGIYIKNNQKVVIK